MNQTSTQHGSDLDTVAAGFQLRSPHRPRRIVTPTTPDELPAIVATAREQGIRIAVQATGHGRTTGADDILLIDTSRLDGVHVDPDRRTARVGPGARWGQVIAAAAAYGLAPLSGSFRGVGVTGYTLGGGWGLLSPRFGLACDLLRSVQLVTPDGVLRRVSAESDPELHRALRGAGANFGVAAELELDLVGVRTVTGGAVTVDLGRDPGLLARWREWAVEQPEELLLAATVMVMPDVSFVPEPLRGRHLARLQLCAPGPMTDEVERTVRGLRGLGEVMQDTVRELPYAESGSIFAEPDAPHGYRGTGWLLDDLTPTASDELPARTGPEAAAPCIVGIRRLSGALRAEEQAGSVVGHRDARWLFSVLSPERSERPDRPAGQIDTAHQAVLEPLGGSVLGRSLNYTFAPLNPDQVAEAYDPADVTGLRRLRDRLDPDRLIVAAHPL